MIVIPCTGTELDVSAAKYYAERNKDVLITFIVFNDRNQKIAIRAAKDFLKKISGTLDILECFYRSSNLDDKSGLSEIVTYTASQVMGGIEEVFPTVVITDDWNVFEQADQELWDHYKKFLSACSNLEYYEGYEPISEQFRKNLWKK